MPTGKNDPNPPCTRLSNLTHSSGVSPLAARPLQATASTEISITHRVIIGMFLQRDYWTHFHDTRCREQVKWMYSPLSAHEPAYLPRDLDRDDGSNDVAVYG